ncbi:hypothetical protein DM01DRAFT_1394053 [Hesseltinella vesiculosa]|uniref:NAD(P)-binding domain-containing protein n=1 Tax=Hesseltinella vesiculosa TaxID=101127 RepID=A0A1X2GBG2_9FUNG|nr:hypothetical protein DM01DRAFT_1394053 [Hesseltinella vesiculosa]
MILILGSGWTGDFLAPLLTERTIPFTATTRDGRQQSIAWQLAHPVNVDALPLADTVIVTFAVKDPALMTELLQAYQQRHQTSATRWILLSSTRPFSASTLQDRNAPLDVAKDTGRLPAEEVVLAAKGCVLHLAGLWGGQRQPKNWVARFKTKEALKGKLMVRQLHLIHGHDVARAILASHEHFQPGRWIVTDGGCYDWAKIFKQWGTLEQQEQLQDLLANDPDVHQPGSLDTLIQTTQVFPRLDSSEFWEAHDLQPSEFLTIS